MEINIKSISNEVFKEEHIENWEYFEYLLSEAIGTTALAFFNITFDRETKILTVPDELDIDQALETVNQYLTDVEDESEWDESQETDNSKAYNEFTKDNRGADDGTFDYAGTFVISILSVIRATTK